MNITTYENYVKILHNELVPALGCTEPIAIAYASAKAVEILGDFPEKIEMCCSGNIVKNVKGVTVPNSGGLRGIEAAAILGAVGGDAKRELEVLEDITIEQIERTKALMSQGFCTCRLQEDVENLYIVAKVIKNDEYAEVTIINRHTLITKIEKNGEVLFSHKASSSSPDYADKSLLNISDILTFANEVEINDIRDVIQHQIDMNCAISREGMENSYGAQVGKTLIETYGSDIKTRARAYAAAGSDARMGGCSLPVVINSGSGNQGMTVSIPVVEYAREMNVSEDKMFRALVLSNLVAIHQKRFIGSLSAYCGAVSAACGAGAGITYLHNGTEEQIGLTIINTIGNVGGIICDGAKSSCAAKISSSVEAAILAHHMSIKDNSFKSGEGIIQENLEETIKSIGYIGRVGMKTTDVEILNIMLNKTDINN
ncbi:MAG: L-serine ammonia-lyase, iron-sulfur-dependent, subunit alpha [Clostridia bacterium]